MLGTLLGFVTARAISADGLRVTGRRRRARLRGAVLPAPSRRPNPSAAHRPRRVLGRHGRLHELLDSRRRGRRCRPSCCRSGCTGTTFQATSVLFFFVVNWSKVGPYYWLGQWTTDNLLTSLVLLPLAPVGVFLGRYLHDRVDDELFFRVVHASLFVIGVKLLYDASGA